MSMDGYEAKLVKGYCQDPEYYRVLTDWNIYDFVDYKNLLFEKYIPKKYRRKKLFTIHNVQYCYHNYKSKCHSSAGGLICGKQHVHTREVISCYNHAYKRMHRVCARSIRIIKKHSLDPGWTI